MDRWQSYGRQALAIAVFLSPVVFWRGTADVFNLTKLTVLWLGGLCGAAALTVWAAERRKGLPMPRMAWYAIGFLAAMALATAFSENVVLSLTGLYQRYGGLIPFSLYALIALAIYGLWWEKPEELGQIVQASAAASVILLSYVILQEARLDWIDWKDPSGGPPEFPVGTMGNSNFAGGYLGIAIPFLIAAALMAKTSTARVLLGVLVGFDLMALGFTQTRGGMIAAGAGIATMLFCYRDKLPRWAKAAAAAAMATGLIVVTLVIWHPGSDEPPSFLSQARTLRTETFTVRTYYWTSAIEIFKDNPVLGTGLDTYYGQYPIYRQPEDGRQLGLTITDKPHNVFLEYAANSGIVGLGSYLLLVGYGLFLGYKSSRRLDGRARLLAVTFTSVLAGYLAQGFFSIDVPPLAVMGWIGLAGIAALADPAARSARDAALAAATERPGKKKDRQSLRQQRIREREQPARWGIHAPIAVGVAVLLALGIIPWLADVKSKEAQVAALRQEGPDEIARLIEAAKSLNPLEPTYRSQAGFHASQRAEGASIPSEKQALLDVAVEHHQAAYRLQSGNLFYILNLARANTQIAESLAVEHFPAANDWWRLGVERDPTDWEIRNSYALFLNTWANAAGDPEIHRLSSEHLSKVVEIKPDLVEAWINLGKVRAILGESSEARRAWEMALMLDPNNQEARDLLS